MSISIPDFSSSRILVVGDVMLDRYWHGHASRISPEAPVPVMRVLKTEEKPGGAGNVALNLATLGAQVYLLGVVGNDEAADSLEKCFEKTKIKSWLYRVNTHPTITKLRALSHHQQLIRLDFEESFNTAHLPYLMEMYKSILIDVDAVILSDYGKGTLQQFNLFIDNANHAGIPVFIDPKHVDFNVYRGATVLTPNLKEFEAVVGYCSSEEELVQKGHRLMNECQFEALLITRGEQGMSLLQKEKPALHISARTQEVFDVTGAGDTVIATLAAAVATGVSMSDAVCLANAAASISVTKLGASTVTIPELRRVVHDLHLGGILSPELLMLAVQDAKAHGEKIVMTNGCFDILHAGHVHYLEQAKQLGDRLIIAVNDDASVARLKGPNRPINSLEKRMRVLLGLNAVDWVVPFSEDTPELLIAKILPDVLVKGGDWKPEQIAGSKYVLNAGGKVLSLDFVEDHSTTSLIEKISELYGSEKG